MINKIVVVTGGAGFVGANLIAKLLKKTKYKIISIDNYSSGSSKNHIKDIRVRYKNLHGAICTKRYSGLAARCVQHEIDHLDGIEYFKRAHPIHQERFKKKWTKMTRLLKKAAKLAK